MSAPASKTELMRSLGRLTRGLSAMFWGLPLALLFSVQAATTNWLGILGAFGGVAPALMFGLLVHGLWLMKDFQKQERIWMAALDQARLLGLAGTGLSPFLHWYQRLPEQTFYSSMVLVLALSGAAFLFCLNRVLHRLAAMLPDETLRLETAVFTRFNRWLIGAVPIFVGGYLFLLQTGRLPLSLQIPLMYLGPVQYLLLLVLSLLPIAITMSLCWKIKEAILVCVFGPTQEPP